MQTLRAIGSPLLLTSIELVRTNQAPQIHLLSLAEKALLLSDAFRSNTSARGRDL
jgi:hypothetical protein